jgi:murein DD-endopeptidase MepM/ murein hydrolase activator NlpD
MSPASEKGGGVAAAPPDREAANGHRDPADAEREEHPSSFDPGLETGYLRRGSRDHDLEPGLGAEPFDPGPGHYDDRRARRKRKREEKAERKRRAQAEKVERKRQEQDEKRERDRRRAAERHEQEQHEAAERRERERVEMLERGRRERERAETERRATERRERLESERAKRSERLESERAQRRERARAEDQRRRREQELKRQREERLRAEREKAKRAEAERLRLRREERKRREQERQRAELARRRKAREQAQGNLKVKPAPAKAGPGGPVRLKTVPAPRQRPQPQLRKAPSATVSLRRPTVKAGLALVLVTVFAALTGSLLGLPVPLLSGSDESEATLAGDTALTGLLDAGTPAGLTKGPYFPVVLDAPADYGEAAAKFHADRGGRKHEGQDLFAKPGTPLIAVRDGIVLDGAGGRNFYETGGGNTLVIYSPIDNRSYVYLHMLKPPLVRAGDRVQAGQPVGQVGCTGACFGPHLHFEVRNGRAYWGADTKAVDPAPLLRTWPQRPSG